MNERIELKNDFLAISVLPDAGGHIASLVDLSTGFDWLWSNPEIPISGERTGSDYARELDSGGWDDILFSIAPHELTNPDGRKYEIPDHGDLVRRRWSVHDWNDGDAKLDMSVGGGDLRYRFSRSIRLDEERPRITLDYALTNEDSFALPWYWCAHALLEVDTDTTIEIPGSQPYRIESPGFEERQSAGLPRWPFLSDGNKPSTDLSSCFGRADRDGSFALKLFVATPDCGAVSIANSRRRDSLTMRVDGATLPWFGLWINNRGWSGLGTAPYRNLGVEPSTAAYDSLGDAIGHDAIPWIRPGETRRWALTLDLAA